jgi:hypothetical protein
MDSENVLANLPRFILAGKTLNGILAETQGD